MQIAVESYKNDGVSFTDWFLDNYEMLLEKEKEQIIQTWDKRGSTIVPKYFLEENITGEQYYNETYNQNK